MAQSGLKLAFFWQSWNHDIPKYHIGSNFMVHCMQITMEINNQCEVFMCGKEVAESMEFDLDSWLHQHIRPQGGSHSFFRYQVCSILQFKNQIEFYVKPLHWVSRFTAIITTDNWKTDSFWCWTVTLGYCLFKYCRMEKLKITLLSLNIALSSNLLGHQDVT